MRRKQLVIFRPRKLKIDHSFKFKLDGKRLVPRVLIDEHLLWNKQVENKNETQLCYRHAKQAPN